VSEPYKHANAHRSLQVKVFITDRVYVKQRASSKLGFGGVYNYGLTTTQLRRDSTKTIRRPTLPPGCCTAA